MVPLGQPTLIMESTTMRLAATRRRMAAAPSPPTRTSASYDEVASSAATWSASWAAAPAAETFAAEVSAEVVHLIDGDWVQGADRDEHGQRRRAWETGWTGRRNRPLATQRGG